MITVSRSVKVSIALTFFVFASANFLGAERLLSSIITAGAEHEIEVSLDACLAYMLDTFASHVLAGKWGVALDTLTSSIGQLEEVVGVAGDDIFRYIATTLPKKIAGNEQQLRKMITDNKVLLNKQAKLLGQKIGIGSESGQAAFANEFINTLELLVQTPQNAEEIAQELTVKTTETVHAIISAKIAESGIAEVFDVLATQLASGKWQNVLHNFDSIITNLKNIPADISPDEVMIYLREVLPQKLLGHESDLRLFIKENRTSLQADMIKLGTQLHLEGDQAEQFAREVLTTLTDTSSAPPASTAQKTSLATKTSSPQEGPTAAGAAGLIALLTLAGFAYELDSSPQPSKAQELPKFSF